MGLLESSNKYVKQVALCACQKSIMGHSTNISCDLRGRFQERNHRALIAFWFVSPFNLNMNL